MIGRVIDGKYRITSAIGEGAMGAVYEALDLGMGRRVAIKIMVGSGTLATSEDLLKRFQVEAYAVGKLDSPHIATVYASGRDDVTGSPFLVMELLTGENLQQLLLRLQAPLPSSAALVILAQACRGLEQAHSARIIHRDIKPANIFLARRANGEVVVKLLDFGIAKLKDDPRESPIDMSLTETGTLLGSPPYMSPEQAEGIAEVDARTDIWSLGAVGYELLSLKKPYDHADTLGRLLHAILSQAPRPVRLVAPWVPRRAAKIIQRALTRERERRFPSAAAMSEAIRKIAPASLALSDSMLVGLTAEERRAGRHRRTFLAASTGALLAVSVAGAAFLRGIFVARGIAGAVPASASAASAVSSLTAASSPSSPPAWPPVSAAPAPAFSSPPERRNAEHGPAPNPLPDRRPVRQVETRAAEMRDRAVRDAAALHSAPIEAAKAADAGIEIPDFDREFR